MESTGASGASVGFPTLRLKELPRTAGTLVVRHWFRKDHIDLYLAAHRHSQTR